jgi:hypothetical protein
MKTITHNGVPRIEARVHRLPIDSLGAIMSDVGPYDTDMVLISELPENLRGHERPHNHLYITTDEEIKEGDWIYETDLNTINQAGKNYKPNDNDRKIIATTDPKLLSRKGQEIKEVQEKLNEPFPLSVMKNNWYLPQIPQSFIEEYCKAGGIDKVMVEVEEIIVQDAFKRRPDYNTYRPKTDSNNCIIIHRYILCYL